ncbi:hypothetical protein NMG60_11002733 [Bertholletia excelsa]
MVHMVNCGEVSPESDFRRGKWVPVKLESANSMENHHGPLNKRFKLSSSLSVQCSLGSVSLTQPSQYNPVDEPSPLGLRLRKSPSFLDLIQMTLSQEHAKKAGNQAKREQKPNGASGPCDKLKASNFPASFLRIGTWEYKSRYEGDLVAKCYFAKHKLVWEVLDGGLKNKIEIQWSDIIALKANYPDDGPGTLDVALARQPLFFRETNPQPRKHTLWQATSDFTGGQASMQRQHFLQCPQGLLGKHFEKLVQCDPRLNFLSQQGEIVLGSPYFEPRISVFDNSNELSHGYCDKGQTLFNMGDATSSSGAQSSSLKNEQEDFVGRPPEQFPCEATSPSSVMDTHGIEKVKSNRVKELKGLIERDLIKVPGLHTSMSMSDLVSHIEQQILEKRTSNSLVLSTEERQCLEILQDISRCLFNEPEIASVLDKKSIMSRVNSLCCLPHHDPMSVQSFQVKGEKNCEVTIDRKIEPSISVSVSTHENKGVEDFTTPKGELDNASSCKQATAMSRKDSAGELLVNLPRIASLPQFLFNI